MIEFRHRRIYDDVDKYKIYMVQTIENKGHAKIIDIPDHWFCCTYSDSREIAKKICNILESVTEQQDPQNWNRQTLKRVQQIVKLMNRISHQRHIYPIPFENLEKILGYKVATWAVTKTYKRQIAHGVFFIPNNFF